MVGVIDRVPRRRGTTRTAHGVLVPASLWRQDNDVCGGQEALHTGATPSAPEATAPDVANRAVSDLAARESNAPSVGSADRER